VDQDYVRTLRLIAMADVVLEPMSYSLRQIFRWYSKEFFTPLQQVDDIPLEEVLQTYFECQYEEMEEGPRNQEIQRLLISPEKLAQMQKEEDAEDAETWEFAREAVAEEEKEEKEAASKPKDETADRPIDPIMAKLAKVRAELKMEMPESYVPRVDPMKIEPDTVMTFEDFDDEDALAPPKPKTTVI
jgi:hypothetical protein